MTRLASTAPDAKAQLYQLLLDRDIAECSVTWGEAAAEPATSGIMVGGVAMDSDWASIGSRRRDESYRIEVVVSAFRSGPGSAKAAEERAWGLVEEVALVARTQLSLPEFFGAPPAVGPGGRQTTTPVENGHVADITVYVACSARL
jgi:hypothetical protein